MEEPRTWISSCAFTKRSASCSVKATQVKCSVPFCLCRRDSFWCLKTGPQLHQTQAFCCALLTLFCARFVQFHLIPPLPEHFAYFLSCRIGSFALRYYSSGNLSLHELPDFRLPMLKSIYGIHFLKDNLENSQLLLLLVTSCTRAGKDDQNLYRGGKKTKHFFF